jgi:MinD superfamily P-loop ATPase
MDDLEKSDDKLFYTVEVERVPQVEIKKKYVVKYKDCMLCNIYNIKCYSSHKKSKKHIINETAETSRKALASRNDIMFKCAYSE